MHDARYRDFPATRSHVKKQTNAVCNKSWKNENFLLLFYENINEKRNGLAIVIKKEMIFIWFNIVNPESRTIFTYVSKK